MSARNLHKSACVGIAVGVFVAACGDKTERPSASRPVILYRDAVVAGNSVVTLANHADPNGEYASKHCEEIRRLYEAKYHERYICSTVQFADFKITLE